MSKQNSTLIGLLVLQVLAIILYPLVFFQQAPQAAVLPPALILLFIITLVAMHSGTLAPLAGRSALVFIQGINIVVRMMMFFPNLKNSTGQWDWALLVTQTLGIALSWYVISNMEKRAVQTLLFKPTI
ncbi:MAG: hypothetical protein JXA33_09475 [Anaerolineae bacterium]|nr:hypothetical protein [Anaerolineae bacterium]